MLEVPESVEYILKKISEWETLIKNNSIAGLYNINSYSENFCRDILNIIFDLKLVNANLFNKNQAAIDLKDDINSFAVQVTSKNTLTKIRHTVKEFVDKNLNEKYSVLKIVILAYKPSTKRNDYTYKNYKFTMNNVIYFNDLISIIKDKLLPYQVFQIRFLFEEEYKQIKNRIKTQKLKEKLINEKLLKQKIINRQIIKSTDYNDYSFYFNRKTFNVQEVINFSNKVLLLGEAALGKTTYLKSIVDTLNENSPYFVFYNELNTYTGQDIDSLIPDDFDIVSRDNIIVVLDGLDEIEEKHLPDFFKKLKVYSNINSKTKILISCRTNFYNTMKSYLSDYDDYYITELNEMEINQFLKNKNVNYSDFLSLSIKKDYRIMITNPFYLNILSDIYREIKTLPEKNDILEKCIETITNKDKKKYNLSIRKINYILHKQNIVLRKMAFAMQCLGKNYITKNELSNLFSIAETKHLENCGLLKFSDSNISFIHNNYGEYLASKEMKYINSKKLEKIIFNKKKVKSSWQNTIAFYIVQNEEDYLTNLIVERNPELIFNIEKDKVPNNKKIDVFKIISNYYMKNNIWFSKNLLYNNKFIEFFSIDEIIDYLCEIVGKNTHYVKTHNALELLLEMANYSKYSRLFEVAQLVLYSNDYNKDDKKNALYILGNGKYGDSTFIRKIISTLKDEENQYIRTGYFYYINKLKLVDEMIVEILNYKTIVGRMVVAKWRNDEEDEEEVKLVDENFEFSRMFGNIEKIESIDYILSELGKDENKKERFDEDTIKKICISICNLDISTEKRDIRLFDLFLTFMNNYDKNSSYNILKIIDSKNLRVKLFEYYLSKEDRVRRYDLSCFINKDCANFFYNQYKENKYSDDVAIIIINSLIYNSKEYNLLKVEYEKRSGKTLPLPYIPKTEEQKSLEIQECFNSVFSKKDFISLVNYYYELIGEEEVKLDDIFSLKRDHWDDEKSQYISHLIYRLDKNKNKIIRKSEFPNMIEKWDWEYFIISEVYDFLDSKNNIKISADKLKIIQNICNKWLKKVDFKKAITYKGPNSTTINLQCLYLATLRRKLGLKFSESNLLDLLEFETIENGKETDFTDIILEVGLEKVKKRVIYNLSNKDLFGTTLRNHIQFCIDTSIYVNNKEVLDYFYSDKISSYTKGYCIKYLIKSNNTKHFKILLTNINDYDEELLNQIIYIIRENGNKQIALYLLKQINKDTKEKIKMFVYEQLIKFNVRHGLKKYYNWAKKNNKAYNDEINKALKNSCNAMLSFIYIKILVLTMRDNFKDNRFDTLYSSVNSAIINVSKKNKILRKVLILIINLLIVKNREHKKIGFLHYTIESINAEHNPNNEISIEEIKKLI